jgi:heme oxygenase (biliverdin-IX-beta and delta-forming)
VAVSGHAPGAGSPVHAEASPDLLHLLRTATRPAHDRIETMLALTEPSLDGARYRAVLARFLGFWLGWEPRVAAALDDPLFFAPRRRAHLLRRDLDALGLPEDEIAALPRCALPALAGPQAALGALYVMEGSTLGGRVLVRHVARRLGVAEGMPGALYFSGYGDATGAMWRDFCVRLRAAPAGSAPEITAAALATFDLLAAWFAPLSRSGVPEVPA